MSLSTGVYFTSTTADRNDWESFSWLYRVQLTDHHSATTSLPTAECTAVSHPAMQPHLLGTIALHCARVNSNGSNALPDITIAMQYMTRHKWRSCNKFGSRILFFFPCTRWFTYSKHRFHAHIPILLMLLSTAVPPQHSTLHLHTAVAHSSGIAPVGNLYCRSSCF